MPQVSSPAELSVGEAEAAGITSDVDVNQQLHGQSAGGDNPPDVPPPEVRPDGSGPEEGTSPHDAEEGMVVVFGLPSGSCVVHLLSSDLFKSGIDYYMRHKAFSLLRVCFIHTIEGHHACSIFASPAV
jgi:hypothetical protein